MKVVAIILLLLSLQGCGTLAFYCLEMQATSFPCDL